MSILTGMKIAILVADGFEQVEMEKPRAALKEAGAETFLISPETHQVQGWHHHDKGDKFDVAISLNQAHSTDYDALLLPGGVINPDTLRLEPKAVNFVVEIHEQNKPIAAICHGPWLLIDAGVVNGRQLTSWASIKVDLINAGAQWLDEAVVCDGKLVTSRKPDDIPQFNTAMIDVFRSHYTVGLSNKGITQDIEK